VFCAIIHGYVPKPARYSHRWLGAVAFEPLNPVTPGHMLVVPRVHVEDFTEWPEMTGMVMQCAAEAAADMGPVNLITSKGREATQSVFHLHVHLIPRAKDDGLALPWYSGKGGHR